MLPFHPTCIFKLAEFLSQPGVFEFCCVTGAVSATKVSGPNATLFSSSHHFMFIMMSPILLFCTAGIRDRPFERQAPRGRVLSEVGRRLLVRFLAALVTLCFGCAAAGKARVSGKCFRGGRYMPVLLYAVFVAGNTVDFYAMGDLRKCWYGIIVLSCFYIYVLDV